MPWPYRRNRSGRSLPRDFAIALARRFWGYESPWPDYETLDPATVARDVYGALRIDYASGLDELAADVARFEADWNPRRDDDGVHYCSDPSVNLSFPEYDAFVLFCMIRRFRPRRVFELGSGMSTRVVVEALAHQPERCEVTCVDAYADARTRESLGRLGVRFLREDIARLDPRVFDVLEAGDVLFIDSSHVLKNFGDGELEYLQVLPRLRPGVVVHVHDVFLPHNYPAEWIVDWKCVLTEQQLLGAYLHDNPRVRVLAANHHNLVNGRCVPERVRERSGGSFWFQVLG